METVERMNNVIYNYFVETYGAVRNKNDDKGLHDKYRDFSKHQLKKELRNLQKDVYVIKYVSKLLRNVIKRIAALYTLPITIRRLKKTSGVIQSRF